MSEPAISYALRIDLYSHGIKVSGYDLRLKHQLLEFCRTLAQFGYVPIGRGKYEYRMVKVYACATKDRLEFRFHRNLEDSLMRHLVNYGVPKSAIRIVKHPLYEPVRVQFNIVDDRELYDYQDPIVDFFVAPGNTKVVTLQTGKGKFQPLDAKVKIPGGWATMGDMRVGTTVTAWDGTPTKVTNVYPQGEKTVYRITFADGRSTEAGAEHLWKVYYVNTVKHRRWRIVDTVEMIRLISMPNPRVYVPLIEPEDSIPSDLPIDPYVLGAFIGDGSLSQDHIAFTTSDAFVVNKLNGLLESINQKLVFRGNFGYGVISIDRNDHATVRLRERLKALNLHGSLAKDKFIPSMYLEGSIDQRWALLQGLMDTDGTANKLDCGGSITYSTSSKQLAEDVQSLVWSLGGIAKITSRVPRYPHHGVLKCGLLAYRVNIRVKVPSLLFSLPRKAERTNDNNQYAESLKLQVKSIDLIGEKECQCIAIDHPDHLYVTDDFVVTHNSLVALHATQRIGQRTMLVIKGMYVDKWIEDIQSTFGLKPGELMVVRGSKPFKTLIELAQVNALEAKFIICTNKTIYNFIKEYETSNGHSESYSIKPEMLYETLGVGLRLIDEVHLDFHLNMRQDMYANVPKTISMSATLESDDPFLNRMYEVNFPASSRAPQPAHDKYIFVRELQYGARHPLRLKHKNQMKQYSHTMYEKSIMRQKEVLNNYLAMIYGIVNTSFISVREPGQKMVVFCSMKEMCTLVRNYLKHRLNQERGMDLKINRYVDEDAYEQLLEADIGVTTIQSAGTAVDIPGLRFCLMTTALSSKQTNEQVVGRLRRLKDWPDVTPEFLFLTCRDIQKHMTYGAEKQQKLDGKVLSFNTYVTPYTI